MAELQAFATVEDIERFERPLTEDEATLAEANLSRVSYHLRQLGANAGLDFDELIRTDEILKMNIRSVTVTVTTRFLDNHKSNEGAFSQESQSGLGYSWSGTYLNAGGGIFIKNTELQLLGLMRQQYGVMDFTFNEESTT